MKKTTLTLLIIFLVTIIFAAQTVPTLQAAGPHELSLTAIPSRLGDEFSLKAKPGETLQTSVRVRNTSSVPVTIQTLTQDFVIGDNGETPVPLTDTEISNRWSLASWTIVTPSVSTLAPGAFTTLTVIIEIPADALPGGHYAMITHQPAGDGATGDTATDGTLTTATPPPLSGTILQQRVGTLLYVLVEGPLTEAAFVRELTFPKFTEYGPVPFSFQIDNQSDVHIRPQLSVEIYTLFGRHLETIPIETRNIFPLSQRAFSGQWDRIWGWGPYQAKVIASYGTSGQVAIAKTTFWLFPLTLGVIVLISILVLMVIILAIYRHFHPHVTELRINQGDRFEKFDT